jgi:poly-gamma-glutamate capsule biosynthesis protein CapA/YwtB (metallophosphatase superfamily)
MKLLASSLLLSFFFNNFLQNQAIHMPLPPPEEVPAEEDSISYVSIAAVGDLMCHSTQFKYVAQTGGRFDFTPCFEHVKPILSNADFCIGNLETTLAGTRLPYSGYPQFNSPDDYAAGILDAGFDMLVTANNHSNDTGEKGILRTLYVLDSIGLPHVGTYSSQAARDSARVMELNGIHFTVLAYTYSTNGIDLPAGKSWLVNPIDSALINSDMEAARQAGAEIIIVFYHFGNEYERSPSAYQQAYAGWAIENGADIILGSHPHVVQPAGYYKAQNASVDSGFIAWSMGNFISNQRDNYTDDGIIIQLTIEKNHHSGKLRISHAGYTPTWVYKGTDDRLKKHIIFPAKGVLPDFLSDAYWKEMDQSVMNTAEMMQQMGGIIFGEQ